MALITKTTLDFLYNKYNKKEYIHPDPLEFLYFYNNTNDREIIGLIASSLAYGRVNQILKSVSSIISLMKVSPYDFLMKSNLLSLKETLKDFKHRFTKGDDIANMLIGAKKIIENHGSLYNFFLSHINEKDDTVLPVLELFVEKIFEGSCDCGHLLPKPSKKSPCKRLNLFLRWMVRKDDVDPGGWDEIPASKLVVPLDTHLHKISIKLGIISDKQANMQSALKITNFFKTITPADPVKYDFVLTRFGIRKDLNISDLFIQN
ncbi:MAG: TIGR02757 family protein [Desulfobacterales bacterium]|nr:TIGR02757 family protein [Desulfobacterales bacterium]